VKSGLQSGDELAAEDTAEYLHRQEERVSRRDPARVIRNKTASGGNTMDMRMMLQPLVPGMQHAEEADLCAEVTRIASNLEQRCGTGSKEQVVDDALVLQCEWREFTGQSEDDVHIADGQQFLFARLEPAQTRVRLASRTMPVATRVVGDGRRMSAVRTAIAMTAERGSAATRDREEDLLMLPGDPAATPFKKFLPRIANNIGQLQRRPIYVLRICSPGVVSVSASSGLAVALRCRCERWR
jgi:hypothetical protein